jgi:hypothetical protein
MFMDHIFIHAEKMVAKHCIMENVNRQILTCSVCREDLRLMFFCAL